jgi:hypothetical protein
MIDSLDLPDQLVGSLSSALLKVGSSANTSDDITSTCRLFISNLRERYPLLVDAASTETSKTHTIDHTLIHKSSAETAFIDIYGADTSARVSAIKQMFELIQAELPRSPDSGFNKNATPAEQKAAMKAFQDALIVFRKAAQDRFAAEDAILARLGDGEEAVIEAIYADGEALYAVLPPSRKYIDAVRPAFSARRPNRKILKLHLDFILERVVPANPELSGVIFKELLFGCLMSVPSRLSWDQESWALVLSSSQHFEVINSLPDTMRGCGGAVIEEGMSAEVIIAVVGTLAG